MPCQSLLTSFDAVALFTSVPGNEVVQLPFQHAKADLTWSTRELMTPEEFGDLLQMVVDTTYFRFSGFIYEQTYSMAGS